MKKSVKKEKQLKISKIFSKHKDLCEK